MKVFVDTNVLVSAVATRGLCADVLREVFSSHELVVSQQVLDELGRTLRLKFRVESEIVEEYIRFLETNATIARPGSLSGVELDDRDDLAILGAAAASGARVLVTGDRELLELARVRSLRILSPRGFWESLRSRRQR